MIQSLGINASDLILIIYAFFGLRVGGVGFENLVEGVGFEGLVEGVEPPMQHPGWVP